MGIAKRAELKRWNGIEEPYEAGINKVECISIFENSIGENSIGKDFKKNDHSKIVDHKDLEKIGYTDRTGISINPINFK